MRVPSVGSPSSRAHTFFNILWFIVERSLISTGSVRRPSTANATSHSPGGYTERRSLINVVDVAELSHTAPLLSYRTGATLEKTLLFVKNVGKLFKRGFILHYITHSGKNPYEGALSVSRSSNTGPTSCGTDRLILGRSCLSAVSVGCVLWEHSPDPPLCDPHQREALLAKPSTTGRTSRGAVHSHRCLSDAQGNTSISFIVIMKKIQDFGTESNKDIETLKKIQGEMKMELKNSKIQLEN